MTRDNQIKGKQAGSQNQGRQKMERADRASEAGRSGGQESNRLGTDNSGPVTDERRSKISGGNEGGGGSARRSDR
jgi:hypothetical protein